jgi:hypothetical protein
MVYVDEVIMEWDDRHALSLLATDYAVGESAAWK